MFIMVLFGKIKQVYSIDAPIIKIDVFGKSNSLMSILWIFFSLAYNILFDATLVRIWTFINIFN